MRSEKEIKDRLVRINTDWEGLETIRDGIANKIAKQEGHFDSLDDLFEKQKQLIWERYMLRWVLGEIE